MTVRDIKLESVSDSEQSPRKEQKRKMLDNKIPIQKYQNYFDALMSDNAEEVDNTLKSCEDAEELNVLLNSPFDFEDDYCVGVFGEHKYRVSLPFHLAVSAGSKCAAEVLIHFGVNTQTKDNTNHNVLHSLVTMATYYPVLEAKICTMFQWLLSEIGKEHMFELLEGENEDGLRPLEYAAQQGALQLVISIFETKEIYVTREDIRGMSIYRWHDITEYESGRRKNKSPLRFMAHLQKEKLTDDCIAGIVLGPLFSAWINAKIKQNWLPAILWLLIRLSFMVTYFIFDVDVSYMRKRYQGNFSLYTCPDLVVILSRGVRYTVTTTLVTAAVALLVFDIVDCIRFKCQGYDRTLKHLFGYKHLIVNTTYYRLCQFFMYTSILISVPLLMTRSGNNNTSSAVILLIDITKVITPIMCVWSVLYFVQLLPVVGSSIISIQGMIHDMGHFVMLYLVMILPFIHVFETFVHHNSKQGCVDEFSSVFETAYSVFRIMLNMIDLTSYNIKNIGILYALHVVFIFLVAIMLINFLVAVMATSASNIAEHQKLILTLNRLALVMTLEARISWLVGWYYRWLGRKVYNCNNGKVYLVSHRNRGNYLLGIQPTQEKK